MNLNEPKYHIDWLKRMVSREKRLKYLFFWGHTKRQNQDVGNFCFSQWYDCPFTVNETEYKTTEHWMMAKKAELFDNKHLIQKIIDSKSPGEAKELGRKVLNFDEQIWIKHRSDIVRIGNIYKFTQNKDLGDYLLQTGERVLVEASPVDMIWGIGLSKDSKGIEDVSKWRGLNLLGFALMEVRDFIRENN